MRLIAAAGACALLWIVVAGMAGCGSTFQVMKDPATGALKPSLTFGGEDGVTDASDIQGAAQLASGLLPPPWDIVAGGAATAILGGTGVGVAAGRKKREAERRADRAEARAEGWWEGKAQGTGAR